MSDIKDWRGTPIEVGATVLTHSKNWGYGLGTVGQVREKTLTVSLKESNYWTYGPPKTTLVTIPHSVTVLTEDMFPELSERIRDLESDVEYYKYEASRT